MKLIFKKHKELELVVLTVGKNFSNLITGSDTRMGLIANQLYDIEQLRTIKPKSFSPPPRVDSEVILLEPKHDALSELYSQLVMLDDRKLKNAFEKILANKTKRQVKEITVHPLFDKKLYELSNREFLELDAVLKNTL
jgi:16S rRNA A1518/A1519 N6-dimethyltransferase RsmA/KsgA/DIM1 with predicted DNA glycosylase/AP lyase activity